MSEWQPIETAPKDGTEILAYSEQGCTGTMLIRWCALIDFISEKDAERMAGRGATEDELVSNDWFYADFVHGDRLSSDCYPSHWQPLPEPPK